MEVRFVRYYAEHYAERFGNVERGELFKTDVFWHKSEVVEVVVNRLVAEYILGNSVDGLLGVLIFVLEVVDVAVNFTDAYSVEVAEYHLDSLVAVLPDVAVFNSAVCEEIYYIARFDVCKQLAEEVIHSLLVYNFFYKYA